MKQEKLLLLIERLEAYAQRNLLVQIDDEPKQSAAVNYLKELPADFVNSYDRLWKERIAQPWRERHQYVQQTRQRLSQLAEKEQGEQLSIDEAMRQRNRAQEFHEKARRLFEEATTFTRQDRFEPHGLKSEDLRVLQEQLKTVRGLRRAYLVRKVVQEAEPFYVLGVVADYTWNEGRSEKDYARLIKELAAIIQLSDTTIFAPLEDQKKFLEGIFSEIPGAKVFSTPYPDPEEDVKYLH